uniref:DZF domain-containing protein n=1 Tax=Ciona savignyi TaxID=51511 RepID=H2Z308_CIOSA
MQDSQIIIQICSDADESDIKLTINIHLTSPAVRTATKTEDAAQDAPGTLNKEKCLKSLAELRHSKWFQACANIIPSCVIVIRILREIKLRCPEWNAISDWALELLVEKSLRTSPVPMSLGGSLQRVMEVIGSGILLAGSGGVQDPCEREEVDVMDHLSEQDREDLTVSAQNFLRMLVFRQAHRVLGMEALPKPEWLVKKTEAISMH